MNNGRLNEIIEKTKKSRRLTNLMVNVEVLRKLFCCYRIYVWYSGDRLTSSILPVKPMVVVFITLTSRICKLMNTTHDIALVNLLIEVK